MKCKLNERAKKKDTDKKIVKLRQFLCIFFTEDFFLCWKTDKAEPKLIPSIHLLLVIYALLATLFFFPRIVSKNVTRYFFCGKKNDGKKTIKIWLNLYSVDYFLNYLFVSFFFSWSASLLCAHLLIVLYVMWF